VSDSSEQAVTESIEQRLGKLRERIDEVDQRLLELLNRRAEISLEVGRIKAEDRSQVFKPFREQEVLRRLGDINPGPLPEKHLQAIYREVLSSSRRLQRPERVVYLGPEGTFSYFVGLETLGRSVDMLPKDSFDDIFAAVVTEEADLGIIPLENSFQGSVGRNLDLFMRYPVQIQAEAVARVSIALLSQAGSMAEVTKVYSHPKALEQCELWLKKNLPAARVVPADSTAAAARMVAENPDSAAVGHVRLADIYGLRVLAEHLEDLPDNWTRFLVIGTEPTAEGVRDKTSILFATPDKPGALARVLEIMAGGAINLTKLESRPMQGEKWRYVFFADLQCDLSSDEYARILEELRRECHTFRILGSYPSGPHLETTL
jgi:chorismate mutase/prephenate dehydratase